MLEDKRLQDTNSNVPDNEGKQAPADDYKAKHDALYGKYTAKAEKELELSKKLFKNNPEELSWFSDSIKNKIVKEEYWYNTFEEAKAVLWENFYNKVDNEDEQDDLELRLSVLEKEKKVAEYKAKKAVLENKIDVLIAKNPNLEEKKSLILQELEKISDSIDIDDRLDTAVSLVKFKYWSNEDINFANTAAGWSKNIKNTSEDKGERSPSLAKIFWNKI